MKLEESKILFIGSKSNYTNNNHILILAGGAGSGKGYVLSSVIGFEGKKFDVDDIKKRVAQLGSAKSEIAKKIQKDFKEYAGFELKDFDFKNEKHVSTMHMFVKEKQYAQKFQNNFFKNLVDNKPNVIFDITLDDLEKIPEISKLAKTGGYPKENIHIVWVLNKLEIALQQNSERERKVPEKILVSTHRGASQSLKEIVLNYTKYRNYIDGDIYIVFNQRDVDIKYKEITNRKGEKVKTKAIDDITLIKLKNRKQSPISLSEIQKNIMDKILEYVPDATVWK